MANRPGRSSEVSISLRGGSAATQVPPPARHHPGVPSARLQRSTWRNCHAQHQRRCCQIRHADLRPPRDDEDHHHRRRGRQQEGGRRDVLSGFVRQQQQCPVHQESRHRHDPERRLKCNRFLPPADAMTTRGRCAPFVERLTLSGRQRGCCETRRKCFGPTHHCRFGIGEIGKIPSWYRGDR